MVEKKVVSTKENVEEKVKTEKDGTVVKTITTTTTETYDDGSTGTKVKTQTITTTGGGGGGSSSSGSGGKPENIPKTKCTTDDKFIQQCLKAHNDYRALHGAPPLVISKELCEVAQSWANKIAAKDSMEHSPWSTYGENVYWGSHDVPDGKTAVDQWYSEIKLFDWKKMDVQKGTGHFTQVIWKGTKEVGVAKATSKKGSTYVVANYNPPGNWKGQFPDNIGKLSGK